MNDAPAKIVVRGLNWLGDAIMSTPALQRLREGFPGARIALLTPKKLVGLWTGHSDIDEIVEFSEKSGIREVAALLRPRGFDLGVVFPNSPRSAMEFWLAGIPRRIGYSRPWRDWFLTERVPPRAGERRMRKKSPREIRRLIGTGAAGSLRLPERGQATPHHVHHYLHLMAALGCDPSPVAPKLLVGEAEVFEARMKFGIGGQSPGPILGLNPGAEYGPAKRWPEERFIEAALLLHRQLGCRLVLFGGRNDVDLSERIAAGIEAASGRGVVSNVAGRTSLRELCALMKACRVVLTNDTGPMHLAAAVGTPVVALFGSTSPEMTGPGLPGEGANRLILSAAPCAPCYLRECPIDFRCLRGISAITVVEAMRSLIREGWGIADR